MNVYLFRYKHLTKLQRREGHVFHTSFQHVLQSQSHVNLILGRTSISTSCSLQSQPHFNLILGRLSIKTKSYWCIRCYILDVLEKKSEISWTILVNCRLFMKHFTKYLCIPNTLIRTQLIVCIIIMYRIALNIFMERVR